MLKILLFFVILAIGAFFVINQIPSLKERVIETFNPAAKEGRLLGELKNNLDEIEKNLEEAAKQKEPGEIREKLSDGKDLLGKSKNLLEEIFKINRDAGIIGSQVGKIIDIFLDRTPYPADHLKTINEIPAPTYSCPPR